MKKLISVLVISFLSITVFSQNVDQYSLDSIFQILEVSEESNNTIDLMNDLALAQLKLGGTNANDSVLLFQEKTIALARKIEYKRGLAEALYILGRFHISGTNNYAKATPFLLESLSLFEEKNDSSGISKCHMQLGVISYILQYDEDALKKLKRSNEYKENPVNIYLIALCYSELNNFSEAKKYFNLAIQHYNSDDYSIRVNECYMYLGKLFEKENNLDSAYYYLNLAIEDVKSNGEPKELIRPYALVSGLYLNKQEVNKAIDFAKSSLDINTSGNDIISKIESLSTLSKAYAIKRDYKKAHYYLELFNTTNNNYVQGSTKQKVADMQSMFDFKKKINEEKIRSQKDKEIIEQQVQKERILRNGFVIGTILLLLLSLVLHNRYKIKRNSAIALREKNAIISIEKERSENLLLNILPAEIAEELKTKGKADARDYDKVSILFTDFKAFTQTSEKLSAQELVAEINTCFEAFDSICGKYEVEKIKTIGDAYMAVGGLPIPTKDSTKNSVLAALEMQEFVSKRKSENDTLGKPAFEMRVGIHTGPVVAGIVGVKKFQYDIWGDTVNTAARFESNGEVGKVNISQSTYELIKNDLQFAFINRGKITVKGKGEMEMYFVTNSFHS